MYRIYTVDKGCEIMDVGNSLKAYRLLYNLTQEELAYKAGINEKYYGRLERNESCPTIETLEKICAALNIDIASFFLFDASNSMDIHFNRDNLIKGCYNCIWYNGYIGSASFEEFEIKLFAAGNVKGKLYKNSRVVLELNGKDISNALLEYVKNDVELNELIECMSYDKDVLEKKNGNALFIQESNWLEAKLVDNENEIVIDEGIILDEHNVLKAFMNKDAWINYIFADR